MGWNTVSEIKAKPNKRRSDPMKKTLIFIFAGLLLSACSSVNEGTDVDHHRFLLGELGEKKPGYDPDGTCVRYTNFGRAYPVKCK